MTKSMSGITPANLKSDLDMTSVSKLRWRARGREYARDCEDDDGWACDERGKADGDEGFGHGCFSSSSSSSFVVREMCRRFKV